jgi:hypothetical protein
MIFIDAGCEKVNPDNVFRKGIARLNLDAVEMVSVKAVKSNHAAPGCEGFILACHIAR